MQVENSIPDSLERERKLKLPFRILGTGIPFPIFADGNASGKLPSQFSGKECEWKIPFLAFGTEVGGQYSQKWPGTAIPAHPWVNGRILQRKFNSNALGDICEKYQLHSGHL